MTKFDNATLIDPSVVFLNGPPQSGKDTIAAYLAERRDWSVEKANQPAVDACATLLGVAGTGIEQIKAHALSDYFPTARADLTVRDMLITFWQAWLKPAHGNDVAGRLLARRMFDHVTGSAEPDFGVVKPFVISDSGFTDEVVACLDELRLLGGAVDSAWPSKATLIHIQRPGRTFEGDSRHWVSFERFVEACRRLKISCSVHVIVNDGSIEELYGRVDRTLDVAAGA